MSRPRANATNLKATQETPALLELRAVSRDFSATHALADLTLDIHSGEFVAIVGPSGSGKSTLLNILGLLDTVTTGTYIVNGLNSANLSEKQRDEKRAETFGFVFQDSHMVGYDTAARNATLGLRARGIGHNVQKYLVGPPLKQFGLDHRVGTSAALLSGGERQRLAIVRAVVGGPRVILADEPTGSLDTANGKIILDHLLDLHVKGVTVIMVTHDSAIAAAASRIITMSDGRIISDTGRAPSSNNLEEQHELSGPPGHLLRRRRSELLDLVADAFSSLTIRPGKALLLILAFFLGSGGLVAAIGLSESAAVSVSNRIDAAANDEVRITRGDGYESWEQVKSDVEPALKLAGVKDAGIISDISSSDVNPTNFRPGSIPDQPVFRGAVRIADSSYLRLQGATVSNGDPKLLDESFGGPVALLGLDAAEQLGIGAPGPETKIWLFGQSVPVVGLIDDPGRDPVLAGAVVVGIDSYPIRGKVASTIVLRTAPGMPAVVAEALPKAISPTNNTAISVQTVADLRELRKGINADLGNLVAIVSIVLLAVACLSAGTTMYMQVLARSREIALRRALGMRRVSLGGMFVAEGAIVGSIGGVLGGAGGMAAVLAYALSEGWTPLIPWYSAVLGLAVGFVSGTLSALYPALAASRANPAQLIRS